MKKSFLLTCLLLAACSNYSPLYAPQSQTEVMVGNIEMQSVARNVGERRVAQRVNQQLRRSFPKEIAPYRVNAVIEESSNTLAVRRDATVARAQMNLRADVTLENEDGKNIFATQVSANAAYNMEDTPYSTESGKTFARMQAADVLASEIARVVWLALREQDGKAAE